MLRANITTYQPIDKIKYTSNGYSKDYHPKRWEIYNILANDEPKNIFRNLTSFLEKNQHVLNFYDITYLLYKLATHPNLKFLLDANLKFDINKFKQLISKLLDKHDLQNVNMNIIAGMIQSLSILKILPGQIFLKNWFKQSYNYIRSPEPYHSSGDISKLLCSITNLGITPSQQWLEGWQKNSNNSNISICYNNIHAFVLLKILPKGNWIEKWIDRSMRIMINNKTYQWDDGRNITSQLLSGLIYNAAKLGINLTDEWIDIWSKRATERISEFSRQSICNSIYAYILMDKKIPDFLLKQLKSINLSDLNIEESMQLVTIKLVNPQYYMQYSKIIDQAETFLKNKPAYTLQDISTSRLHLYISKLIRNMGITYKNEYKIAKMHNMVDIYIANRNLIIQVDGPLHYLTTDNGEKLNPATELNSKLLRKLGYNVIRLDYKEINRLKEEDKLVEQLKTYIEAYPTIKEPQNNKNEGQQEQQQKTLSKSQQKRLKRKNKKEIEVNVDKDDLNIMQITSTQEENLTLDEEKPQTSLDHIESQNEAQEEIQQALYCNIM